MRAWISTVVALGVTFVLSGCGENAAAPTTPGPPLQAPAPAPDPIPEHCQNGSGQPQNLRITDQGNDWVTYAWEPDVCLDQYDVVLRMVHDFYYEPDGRYVRNWNGFLTDRAVRVDEPTATFRGLKDGVYGPIVTHPDGHFVEELGPGENPYNYSLYERRDRPYYDYPVRYESWDQTDFVCYPGLEDEAYAYGSILLEEWHRGQRRFVVNVEDEVDQASDYDARLILAEVEDAADRFEDVLGFRLLEAGKVTPSRTRGEGEIQIGYGQYPDQSQPWSAFVTAFAAPWDGRITLTGLIEGGMPGETPLEGVDLERELGTLDQMLIHEIFHLWGFRHATLEGGFSVSTQSEVGVPMTPEMTGPSVDTLLDFDALRCILGL